LPVTLRGFYRLKPLKRFYLDPDAELEVVMHKPIGHHSLENISGRALLELTKRTIEAAYIP